MVMSDKFFWGSACTCTIIAHSSLVRFLRICPMLYCTSYKMLNVRCYTEWFLITEKFLMFQKLWYWIIYKSFITSIIIFIQNSQMMIFECLILFSNILYVWRFSHLICIQRNSVYCKLLFDLSITNCVCFNRILLLLYLFNYCYAFGK